MYVTDSSHKYISRISFISRIKPYLWEELLDLYICITYHLVQITYLEGLGHLVALS